MVRAWLRRLGKTWAGGPRGRAAQPPGRLGVEALEAREVMTAGLLPAQHLGGPQKHALVTPNDTPDQPAAAVPLPGGAAAARGPRLNLPSAFDRAFPPQAGPAARDGGPRLDLGDAKVSDLARRLFGARPDPAAVAGAGPQLAELFRDAGRYHRLLAQAFGEGYDRAEADRLRAQALKGDFSFLPPARFLDRATLLGHHAAYDGQQGVVYLARDLKGNPAQLRAAYLEELGHHLDRRLNTADTKGDEGELFRRLASGERLTARQLARVRAENDAGVITVDGRQVQVEFFFKKIAKAISSAAKAVGGAVTSAAKDIGGAVAAVGKGFVNAAKTVGSAVVNDFGRGVFGNLVQGRFGAAVNSAVNGVSNIVAAAPAAIANGYIDGTAKLLQAPTHFLGKGVGGTARDAISRGADVVRTVTTAGTQIAGTLVRAPFDAVGSAVGGVTDAAKELFKGNFGEAGKKLLGGLAGAAVKVPGSIIDAALIGVQGATTIIGDIGFLHAPSRELNAAEKAFLQRVYGGSLNTGALRLHIGDISHELGVAPHALGNDIYIPKSDGAVTYVSASGDLTPAGLQLLAHEAAHTWQSQTGGNSYIHESLAHQVGAIIKHGDRNVAYRHHADFIAGKAFESLNPEQQAEVIEDIGQVLLANPNLNFDSLKDAATRQASKRLFDAVINPERAAEGLSGLSDAEYSRLLGAWAHVRSGGRVPTSTTPASFPVIGSLSIPLQGAGQSLKSAVVTPAVGGVFGTAQKPAVIAPAPLKAAPPVKAVAKPIAALPQAPRPVGAVINLGSTIAFTKRK